MCCGSTMSCIPCYVRNVLWFVLVFIYFIVVVFRYDCGIIVLQMMELWDGHKKFDGNTMPNYTNVSSSKLMKYVF